jgi:pilus assembly protein Flp/PilA
VPNPADNTTKILTGRLGRMQHVRTHHRRASAPSLQRGLALFDSGGLLPMKHFFVRFIRSEAAVTAVEYGLIAGLIAIAIITAASAIGTQIAVVFTGISSVLAP